MKEQGLTVKGRSSLRAHVDGPLADIAHAKIRAKATLKDASVESAKLKQKIEKISGSLTYESPTLFWKDFNLDYQGKTYILDGYLQDFESPFVAGSVKSTDMSADFQVKKKGDDLKVERLTGSCFDSTFDVNGLVKLAAGTEPTMNVKGDIKLSLNDLSKFLPPAQVQQIAPLKLTGVLKITADIKGKAADWTNWTSEIAINTPAFSMMGYAAQNLAVKMSQKNGVVDPLTVDGDFYEGVIHSSSRLDLTKTALPFKTKFSLDATNLEQLKRVTPLKDRRVEGLLTFTTDLKGNATDLKSWNGTGSVEVKDGYLFDMPGLSILGEFLQSSAKSGDITSLKTVSTNFKLEAGRVTTDDLSIKGPAVEIAGQGWVDMDQTMDMTFKTKFLATQQTGTTGNLLSAIDPTGELTAVQLYGPISNPKRKISAADPAKLIPNILKNTGNSILQLFQ